MELTTFDKDLLNLLQGSLPVCSRPFAALAEKLGTTEEAVIDRLQVLKEEGYLRRIGTFFNSGRLGYKGTLVALRVDPEKMEAVAKAINRYPGATHNYEREGRYNLWFTLLTPGLDKEHEILHGDPRPARRRGFCPCSSFSYVLLAAIHSSDR